MRLEKWARRERAGSEAKRGNDSEEETRRGGGGKREEKDRWAVEWLRYV